MINNSKHKSSDATRKPVRAPMHAKIASVKLHRTTDITVLIVVRVITLQEAVGNVGSRETGGGFTPGTL